jgi:hypothetical protein
VAFLESGASFIEALRGDSTEGKIPNGGVGTVDLAGKAFDPARVRGADRGKLRRYRFRRLAAYEARVDALEALLHPVEVHRLCFA